MRTLKIIKGLRKGQHIANFLDYFSQQEEGDIYYVSDKKLDEVWRSFMKIYERSVKKKKSKTS